VVALLLLVTLAAPLATALRETTMKIKSKIKTGPNGPLW
jgi:hypothetical protein